MNDDNFILVKVDGLIADYQYVNDGTVPSGIKMNTENAIELRKLIEKLSAIVENVKINHLRGSKIIIDDSLDFDQFILIP